jgi:hypothetical protein
LEITDRITIVLEDAEQIHNAVMNCGEYIQSQVLATSITLADGQNLEHEVEMDGYNLRITIQKA